MNYTTQKSANGYKVFAQIGTNVYGEEIIGQVASVRKTTKGWQILGNQYSYPTRRDAIEAYLYELEFDRKHSAN